MARRGEKISLGITMRGLLGRARRYVWGRYHRAFGAVGLRDLVLGLRSVGLERGVTVCVHSSLSRLGYVQGGADMVIDAILECVGPEGSVMMPSFPSMGAMAEQLARGELFDVRYSPSRVGIVTEAFRRRPGVARSLHPTNPVAGWGRGIDELLKDHDRSPTPYGVDTPYGRLANIEDAFILMMETHIHSFLHHLQERVGFPTLFLPEKKEAVLIDWCGRRRRVVTRVMRPRVPYFVAIPAASGADPDWAILHDFALIFPARQEAKVRRLGYHFEGYPRLFSRREEFERSGALRTTRVGAGEIGLLRVKPFLEAIEPEFLELIDRFRPHYDADKIAALGLPYT